ncbi:MULTISPECIES: YolA family protein [unclassified Pseudomonas]|uniref:YolA family protein n=1 Tax=unclassified Pseudomonas TaxID=196821 RepID=UPI0021605706|nr:YolA family protein [Pseudomonas sp. B21-015]UVM51303.1 YolA family protein [Pseudomonas sp. B21-015]
MKCMNRRAVTAFAILIALFLGAQIASAATAPPLSQVKVLKVESPGCGFESIADGQAQTRCDHKGPNIKVYVLEVGYGRQAHVALDGFEVDGTRTKVCAFDNGNLTDCSERTKVVGFLYIFDLKGKQDGNFTFSNTSINAPGNTMSTQLYIK